MMLAEKGQLKYEYNLDIKVYEYNTLHFFFWHCIITF
jgi:hypothetical protein